MNSRLVFGIVAAVLLVLVVLVLSGMAVDIGSSGGCEFVPGPDPSATPMENPCITNP